MAEAGEAGEVLLDLEVLVDAIVGQAVVLGFVSLHLGDEVHEVLGLGEELELLGVDQVAELVLDLDHQLNNVEAVKTVVDEGALERNRGLLGRSEVALYEREHVLLDLVVGLEHEGVLLALELLPEGDLVGLLELLGDEVLGGVEAELALEAAPLLAHELIIEVEAILAAAEADVLAGLGHLGQLLGGSEQRSLHHARQHFIEK